MGSYWLAICNSSKLSFLAVHNLPVRSYGIYNDFIHSFSTHARFNEEKTNLYDCLLELYASSLTIIFFFFMLATTFKIPGAKNFKR